MPTDPTPTTEQMAELRAKATPGDWIHRTQLDDGSPWSDLIYFEEDDWGIITGEHLTDEDAAFIAAASRFDFATASANERRLAEVEGENKRLIREASNKTHGASGMCCQLRVQEKRRADELEIALRNLIHACPTWMSSGPDASRAMTEAREALASSGEAK